MPQIILGVGFTLLALAAVCIALAMLSGPEPTDARPAEPPAL